MSNTRKRSSQSKAAIEASLEMAREYAQLLERIRFEAHNHRIVTDRDLSELPTRTQVVRP
jgi:hypothetical protein